MNTEHTNQSSLSAPVPHSPIDLQSIPDRQRSFTAENIRDIAHDCIRIGDNDQAEAVFAITDALRDGNLIIQSPDVAVPDSTVGKLRLLVAACNRIEEEAEEFEGPDGLQMGIAMDYWHEFAEALTTARKAVAAAPQAAVLSADAKRYHALREAVISAANGERHPVESAITAAMREAHAKNGSAAPDFDAIDRAIDECMAVAQKGGA